MATLHIRLFGKLSMSCDGKKLDDMESNKVQELFCYLLLHRQQTISREFLGSILWDRCTTARSKAYLRKTLWQLQTKLDEFVGSSTPPLLRVGPEWIQIDPSADIWLDVAVFEAAYRSARGTAGALLDARTAQELKEGVKLYTGDLLENLYSDWSLLERERLQQLYLRMLDRLLDYCQAHEEFDAGLEYGGQILAVDRARERTHYRLMHLRYLSGDRTGALRQYERCRQALGEELDVKPSRRTQVLYSLIREDQMEVVKTLQDGRTGTAPAASSMRDRLKRIKQIQNELFSVYGQLQSEIEAIELTLRASK